MTEHEGNQEAAALLEALLRDAQPDGVAFSPSTDSELRGAKKAAEDAFESGDRERGEFLIEEYVRFLREAVDRQRDAKRLLGDL